MVVFVTEAFVSIAKSLAKTRGFPDLPMVVVAHPFETLGPDVVSQFARDKFPELLTRMLGTDRRAPARPISLEDE